MWEYKVLNTLQSGVPTGRDRTKPRNEQTADGLNILGLQGWELCGVLNTLMFFKRPLRSKKD